MASFKWLSVIGALCVAAIVTTFLVYHGKSTSIDDDNIFMVSSSGRPQQQDFHRDDIAYEPLSNNAKLNKERSKEAINN